jgi:hypothetical protein
MNRTKKLPCNRNSKLERAISLLRQNSLCVFTDTDEEIIYQPAGKVAGVMLHFAEMETIEYRLSVWNAAGIPADETELEQLAFTIMKSHKMACSPLMARAFIIGLRFAAELKVKKEFDD